MRHKTLLIISLIAGISTTAIAQRKDTVQPVFKNLSEMKSTPSSALDAGRIYTRDVSGMLLSYKWNPASTGKDDSVTVVQRTGAGSGRFELYYEQFIHVGWFGAIADDNQDDSRSIQKAIDFAMNSTKNPVVQLSGGIYQVNNVIIGKKSGNEYDFVTLTMRGNSNLVAQTTQFTCNNKNAFCLNIQRGRSVVIENIRFNGSGPSITGLRNMVEASEATYTAGLIANQYSQHNGISIDAFHSSVPANMRYPDVPASWYSNASRGGTSMVTIRNCSFVSFVNAIIESPTGMMQNGDNVLVSECYFQTNKNCFSAGQTQSRANKLIGCYMIFNQTIVNGQDYGSQQGTVADIINCNIAGGTKYLYQFNGGFAGVSIVNTFAESLYSFGISGEMPVTFMNSQITMMRDDVDEMFIAPVVAQGRQLTFVGGSIEYFDNISATPFVFNIFGELSFNGTKIRGGVPLNSYYNTGRVKFNSVNFTSAGGAGRLDETSQTPYEDISMAVNKPIIPGMNYKLRQGINADAVNDKIETTFLEQARIRVNASNHTAWFISTNPGRYRRHDALAELGPTINNQSPHDRYAGTQGSLGIVIQISGDTIKLRYVPYGIKDNVTRGVSLVRIPVFLPRIIGDLQSGSNVIRNVQVYGGTLYDGVRIKGTGIPDGAYITKVETGKLTISMPATANVSNNPLYDAKVVFTATSSSPVFPLASLPIFYPGDYVDAEFSNTGGVADSIARWYCVRAGVAGGHPAPMWRALKFGGGTSGGGGTTSGGGSPAGAAAITSGTYTPSLTAGTNVDRATATVCQYMRVGNIVTVSGEFQIDAKAAGFFEVGMSLPVAVDLTTSAEAAGTASSGGVALRISGDATNNRASITGVAANGANTTYSFSFTYKCNQP